MKTLYNKIRRVLIPFVALYCGFFTINARAQSATDLLKQAVTQYVQEYATPAVDMFSAVLNSGQFHSAETGGFHVYVSLQMTGAIVPESEKNVFSFVQILYRQ